MINNDAENAAGGAVVEAGFPFEVGEMEGRWQAAWREAEAFATPAAEDGRHDVRVWAAASPASGPVTLDQARRYVLADMHARFRRMRGDAVLFSPGFETEGGDEGAGERRRELEALGLSADWSRGYESAEAAARRWVQRVFLGLVEAGAVYRADGPMRWCESCRTVLADGGGGEECVVCAGPVRRLPAGQWYLKVDANARAAGDAAPLLDEAAAAAGVDLLGRVEGVEIEGKALDGSTLPLFTPHPKKAKEARFVAVSPGHPALETLVQDPDLKKKIARMAAGGSGGGKGFPLLSDTGAWIHVPGLDDPLPLVVSPAVDARYGVAAVLGIPAADPHDERLAQRLPSPPSLRWDMRVKSSKPRPAVRFRAHVLPISSAAPQARGVPLPVANCEECGAQPLTADSLPLAWDAEPACPRCGKPAAREAGTLDPDVATWAEMLPAIPPSERADAALDHPELRRWMASSQSLHGSGAEVAPLASLVALEALREHGGADLVPNGEARSIVLGELGEAEPPGLPGIDILIERFGADTLRLALVHAAAPGNRFSGDQLGGVLVASERFLVALWRFSEERLAPDESGEPSIDTSDPLRRRLAKWCDIALGKVTENYAGLDGHRAARNVIALLNRIEDFEGRVREQREEMADEDRAAVRFALGRLIVLLAPIAPHIAEELWARGGNEDSVALAPWPESALRETDSAP